jgi:prostaglandin-H2 D-isomerase / glutathione transferase
MTKPKLTYFDAPVSRGEECRLALHLAGVDFEDVRIKMADWPAMKPSTPFGSLPVFELPGRAPLAQTNAILTLIGRTYHLLPEDEFEAARHLAAMEHVEDLRHALSPTLRMPDPVEKQKAREQLAATYLPAWGASVEKQIAQGPFFGGGKLSVADLKIFSVVRWIQSGTLDHIPKEVFAPYSKLTRLHDAVRDQAGVKAWYARF